MAKNKTPETVDELLGQPEDNANTNQAPTGPVKTKEEFEKEIAELQAKIKATRAEMKGEKPKKEKVVKGVMVTFQNKEGKTITGMGTRYYVVRQDGKLHYKAEDAVHVLTQEEIDALPKDNAAE